MIDVSIIIPLYNAEKTMDNCIEGLLKQTFQNYELILVDDGSTDSTLQKCQKYASIYPFIKLISHKNHGVSYSRNCGIKKAEGNYIMFADADDYILPDMIEKYYSEAESTKADIVIGGIIFRKNGKEKVLLPPDVEYDSNTPIEYIVQGYRGIFGYVPNKMYLRSLIIDNNIEFPEDCSAQEDLLFALNAYDSCAKITQIQYAGYVYIMPENEKDISPEELIKHKITIGDIAVKRGIDIVPVKIMMNDILYNALFNADSIKAIKYYIDKTNAEKWTDYSLCKEKEKRFIIKLSLNRKYRYIYGYFRIRKVFTSLLRNFLNKKIKERIYIFIKTFISFLFCICPIDKRKIVFESFGGKNFSDNPKMIALEILKEDKPWHLVWLSIDKPPELPGQIRWVKYDSFKALYEWCTAKVWIDNVRHQVRPIKRKKQYYIQTWHGTFSIKRIEKDAEENLDKDYLKSAKKDGRITNAIVSNSKLLDDIYKRAFWLNKKTEILKVGLPRNDTIFQYAEDITISDKIRQYYNIDNDDFLVLYAPTFRDDHSTEGYIKSFNEIKNAFEIKLKRKCCVLIRMHPNVQKQALNFKFNNQIIDVTDYADMQELAVATDCIISDYSSTIFDYVMLKKPVFICALDIEHYDKMRGILPVFYELPFNIAETTEALVDNIKTYDEELYFKQVDEYFAKNPFYDKGDASKKIVEKIQTVIDT